MTAELVSIVVPVYKAETTLERCIDSLLSQTYENIELILVDDGSPDQSGEICKRYAKQDSRVRYIHKENRGVSSARNRGIDEAKGAYISFCDSDDWVEPETLQSLYEAAKEHDAEVVLPRTVIHIYDADGSFVEDRYDRDDFFIRIDQETFQESFDALFTSGCCYSTQGRLYRLDFLRQHRIRFNEQITVLEDLEMNLQCFRAAKQIVHINKVLYNFFVVDISKYMYKRKNIDSLITSITKVYEAFAELFAEKNLPFGQFYYDFIMSYWIMVINNILRSSGQSKGVAMRTICNEIAREQVYLNCNQGKIDTAYKILLKTKSIGCYRLARFLKQIKNKIG